MRNVYEDPSYAEVRMLLHEKLLRLQAESGDTDPDEKGGEWFKGAGAL